MVSCPSSIRPSGVNNFGVATITQTNIIRSVSNFGNRKDHMKCRSSSNMSEIGQPELGLSALEFLQFSSFSRCCNDNEQILSDPFQTLEIGRSLRNTGQV